MPLLYARMLSNVWLLSIVFSLFCMLHACRVCVHAYVCACALFVLFMHVLLSVLFVHVHAAMTGHSPPVSVEKVGLP